jgi:nucleotide-binding universal stress UspA family protein
MRAEAAQEHEHRIVVGVDGSGQSVQALAWASRQAKLTGATVEAVIAWDFPAYYGHAAPAIDVDWEGMATQVVTRAVAEVSSASPGTAAIRYKVCQGNAAAVLLNAAAGADLLVVGSRGHGGFAEALLGSVGQHCVQHASCPVVVIRGEPDQEKPG